jgi:hypothetical protein
MTPFETKANAIEHAVRRLLRSQRPDVFRPRSPHPASSWRLGGLRLRDLGEPLRQGGQLGRGLVRRGSSGRELLLVGLPCSGPFARQGGQSGYCAVGRCRSAARSPLRRSLSAVNVAMCARSSLTSSRFGALRGCSRGCSAAARTTSAVINTLALPSFPGCRRAWPARAPPPLTRAAQQPVRK